MARKAYPSAISVAIILVAAIVTATGFGSVGIVQGQGNETAGNMTLTPEQKDAICNPNNPLSKLNPVNTTESKSSNMTTGEEAPPTSSSIAPSANTTTGMETETPPSNLAPSAAPPLDE
jgi:hypothetical protein